MTIRIAAEADAPAVATLLGLLGYPTTAEEARRRIRDSASVSGAVLVAETNGEVVGLLAITWASMLHYAQPVARVMALIVADSARRSGVGRQLVDHATALAEEAGCGQIEVTTSLKREDAHRFYGAQGFILGSYRLHKPLA